MGNQQTGGDGGGGGGDNGTNDPLLKLRQNLLHTTNSKHVREKIRQLVNDGNLNLAILRSESSLNVLKNLARVHGLPGTCQPVLINLLQDKNPEDSQPPSPSYKFKIFLTLKYSVKHDHDFISLQKLVTLLLEEFPVEQQHQNKDFFKSDSITQLMLAIITIMNPQRIDSEKIDKELLWKLENYLPFISGNPKGEVKRFLEKMGYWSGNSATQQHGRRKKGASQNFIKSGDEIIRSVQKKKGINVSAHVVKTQQTEAVTTEENVSEKTQMSNISLSNALNEGRNRTVAASRARETLPNIKSADGSDRCWWKTTSTEINNFLTKARGGGAISPDDVEYLENKLTGYKFSFSQGNRDMIVMIAEIFYLISKYQKLKTDTVLKLLDSLLSDDHNGSRYSDARMHVLQATDAHCNRSGQVPEQIQKKLTTFRDNSKGCSKRMKTLIWNILSTDDSFVTDNIRQAIVNLETLEDCESGLNYLQRQITMKGRSLEFKEFPEFVPSLFKVAQGKFGSGEGDNEEEEEISTLDLKLQWSEMSWLDTLNYPGNLGAAGTLKLMKTFGVTTLDKLKWKSKKEDDKSDEPDPAFLSAKSLEILEDFLQIDWTPGLTPEEIEIVICLGLAMNCDEDMKGKTVRCMLRSFEKGLKNPDWNYFDQFTTEQLERYFSFLLNFTTSTGTKDINKRLQIFTLILLGNILEIPKLKKMASLASAHLPFFRKQLQRNDIILPVSVKVVVEEELDKEFFLVEPPPEEYELVSTYVAKILLRLVEQEASSIDELTLSVISQVLLSTHAKMTKILLSELLFTVAKSPEVILSSSVLNSIQGQCFSHIADVHVYITAAYCTALANPQVPQLDAEQVNFLINLYSFKKVCLDKTDFSEWINPNILKTFQRACIDNLKLSEQVFHLLALVLNNTCADSEDSPDYPVVEMILNTVSIFCNGDALQLPTTMVEAIENLLLESDVFDETCAGIVEQCMLAGRWVADSVIEEFAKYLWHEPDTSIPFLRRLAIANENQELPDSIFDAFQMELIGLRLHPDITPKGNELLQQINFDRGDPQELFKCLSDFITKGKFVSPLNLQVLGFLLDKWKRGNERTKLIENITWVLANGQSLPKGIIESALLQDGDYLTLLEFAGAVVKIGQQLPESFLLKVCKELESTDGRRVLTLIKKMIQHNHPLPQETLDNYLTQLLQLSSSKQGSSLPPDLLSSVIHLLENKTVEEKANLEMIKDIFLKAVESQSATLIEIGKKGLKLLPKEMLGEAEEEELGLKGISVGAATLIARWLARRRRPLSRQLLQFIGDAQGRPALAKWTSKRRDELEGELAVDAKFVEKVGKLLFEKEGPLTEFETVIAESLFFTIANWKGSEEVKNASKKALEEIVKLRRFIPNRTCLSFLAVAEEEDRSWLERLKEHDEALIALERWKQKPSSNKRRAALGHLLEDPQFCTKYHSQIFEAILSTSKKEWKKLPNVANALAASIAAQKTSSFSPEIVDLIEQEILEGKGDISLGILEAYEKIQTSSEKIQPCLVALTNYFKESKKDLNSLEIIRLFRIFKKAAQELQVIPSNLLNFVLSCTTTSKNPLIRGKSLGILLSLRQRETNQWKDEVEQKHWPTIFRETLDNLYEEMDQDEKDDQLSQEEEENLLYILHTLAFWELGGLRKKSKKEWAHHLLISDTILSLASSFDEEMELFPIASKFCSLVSPGERLDILESVKGYQRQYISSILSPSKLLSFVNSHLALENKTEPAQAISVAENCGTAEWLHSIIFEVVSKSLCEKIPDLSEPLAKIILEENGGSLPVDILELVISKLDKGSGLRQFQKLLEFLTESRDQYHLLRTYLKEIEEVVSLQKLQSSLQAIVLGSILPKVNIQLTSRLENEIGSLLSKNYDYSSLHKLISKISKAVKKNRIGGASALEILENILHQMEAYSVSTDRFTQILATLLEEKKISEWVEICNHSVMEYLYSGSNGVKSAESIAKEFTDANTSLEENPSQFSQLVKDIRQGSFKSELRNELGVSSEVISKWNTNEIGLWAAAMKRTHKKGHQQNLTEILAVISRACVLLKHYQLTPIQILSIQSAVGSLNSVGKGRLLQVATGSGKSTIIVAIAIVKSLQDLSVDIYTSSPVLAERDAKSWAPFYKVFGFACDHNGDKGSGYIKGEKNCYKGKKIVYGDTSQFQFDALRDEYSGLRTRAGRQYSESFAIVDEVDSMLVDDSSKLARLSSTLPGMDLLQIVYHLIWQRLFDIQQRLYCVKDETFYLEGARSVDDNGNLLYTYQLPDGKTKTVQNIAMHILHNKDNENELEKAFIYKVNDIDNFVSDHLKKYTKALIGEEEFKDGGKLIQKLPLPKPLVKFAKSQVNNWIDSAMTAVTFQENVHYVVDQEQIKPVDFHTTGIIQSSTNWNNGLHQFLQIKHNLKVSTETVTTNFLSNMAMLQKYGKDLIGFTGTLGSEFGQKVLKDVYDVETVIIPELYYKLFQQLPDRILQNEREWANTVVHSALHESAKNRAVLVICQTIKQAELIADKLGKEGNDKVSIKLYTRNDQNQEKQVEQVNPGDIIVATNLAGRGTDIKTEKVERFGGLHVILTFLPDSLRVEEQAFGRTARQGNKGSGELVLVSGESSEALKRRRDMHERFLLSNFQESELITIQTKDRLFSKFCKVYSRIRAELTSRIWELFGFDSLTVFEQTLLQSIEQEWATFLKRIDDGEVTAKEADDEYENFEIMIEQDFKKKNSISRTESCFYWIQHGNQHVKKKQNDEALKAYNKAISIDSDFSAGAHAGKGFLLLRTLTPKDTCKKVEAISHLNEALKILYTEISLYSTVQTLVQQRGGRVDSELSKQLTEKIDLIGEFCRNVEGNLATTSRSLRRVYATEIFEEEVEETSQVDDVKPTVQNRFGSKSKFNLEFHDLTHFKDYGLHDMAGDSAKGAVNFIKKKTVGGDDLFETSEYGLQCQALDTIENCKSDCKKFAIQVDNQNLKELLSNLEEHTKSLPVLQLNKVNSWAGVRNLVSKFTPKTFTLIISGDKQFALKLPEKLSDTEEKKFTVSYEDDKQVIHKKTLKKGFDPKEIPDGALLKIEIEFEKTNEMANLKTLNLDPEISIVLKDVKKEGIDTHWETLLQGFNENSVTFTGMDTSKIKSVIKVLRNNNIQFILRLEDLSHDKATKCLNNAARKQEGMQENEMKEMGNQYSTEYIPLESLRELIQRGILLMPVFGEKAFIPWRSVISVGILATIQVGAGAVLVCTGFGATVGMGMITEGMSDYVAAYRAYSSRQFDWTSYAIQKAVSLTISVVSMGLGALKDGAKGAAQIGQAAASEVVEQAGTKLVTGIAKETLNGTIQVTAQNLKSLVVKQIMVQATETAVRTGVNAVVESVAEFAFESAKEHILLEVDNTVKNNFKLPACRSAFATYTAMDMARRYGMLETKVNTWLNEVTNPQSNNWNKAWDQVGYPLINGILSDPKYLGSTFSMTTRLIGMIHGSKEILTVVSKVTQNIEGKLKSEVATFTPATAIQERYGLSSGDAEKITAFLVFERNDGTFKVTKFPNETDLESCKVEGVDMESLQNLFKTLHETESKFKFEGNLQMSKLIKTVVSHLATHIIHVANRQLVSPITTLAVGKLVASISQEIQSKYLVSDSQMSEDQRKVKQLKEKDPSELSSEEKQFLRDNDRPVTFAEQIRGNAKDYTVAYQKRDIIANIMTMTEEQKKNQTVPDKFTKEADKAIDKMLNGGPADMTTVFMLAQLNGANVKMVDDPDYVPTKEDKESGVQIIVWEKPEPGQQVGHYMLKDPKTGETKDFPQDEGGSDCAYKVLGHITGKSPDELRLQGVVFVACNQDKFGEINKSAEWIRDRYPQEANSMLHVGGMAKKQAQLPEGSINPDVMKKGEEQPQTKDDELKDKDGKVLHKTLRVHGDRTGNNTQYNKQDGDKMTHKLENCFGNVIQDIKDGKASLPEDVNNGISNILKSNFKENGVNGVRLDYQGPDSDKGSGKFLNFQIQINGLDRKDNKGNSTTCSEVHVPKVLIPYFREHPDKLAKYFQESYDTGKAVFVGINHSGAGSNTSNNQRNSGRRR